MRQQINSHYKNEICTLADPKGGIGIFVCHPFEDKVLIGRRKDNGLLAQPGGWLEYGEEWTECGVRELREETGLDIPVDRIKHIKTFNCYDPYNKYHNVAIYLYTKLIESELNQIKTMEPDKCESWEWLDFRYVKENKENFFFPVRVFFEKEPKIKQTLDLMNLVKY
jgi:8-oxo-dGTP diphosphatase